MGLLYRAPVLFDWSTAGACWRSFSAFTQRENAAQYPASATRSALVSRPTASSSALIRRHSRLASASRNDGHLGMPENLGSLRLSLRLPGLPSSCLSAVGFGGGPGIDTFCFL